MRNQFDNIGMNKIATDCNNSQRSVQQIDPISTIKNSLQQLKQAIVDLFH